jgi:hypothetical protein
VSGCAADPCDGVSGICLSARVEGSVGMLDQLRIAVDGVGTMSSPVTPGASFGLPVKLAIGLPASVGSSARITVGGELAGAEVASSGAQTVPLNPNGRASYTFTLLGGAGDGGGDLSLTDGNADLTMPGVTISPSMATIPPVARNGVSGKVTFTITNNTSMPRTPMAVMETIPGGGPFSPDMSSTCPLSNMGINPLPAMTSCTLVMTIKTSKTLTVSDTFTVPLDDGENIVFTINGSVTPIWSQEVSGSATSFTAVWASGPTDWWAVGKAAGGACPVWHSNGDAQWNASCGSGANAMTSSNLYSVGGSAANDVWLGADLEMLWHTTDAGLNWTQTSLPMTTPQPITGIYSWDAADQWATDSIGVIWCTHTGVTVFGMCSSPPAGSVAPTFLYGFTSASGKTLTVGGPSGALWTAQAGATWNNISIGGSVTINGAWSTPSTKDQFIVGVDTTNNTGVIKHVVSGNAMSETPGNSMGGLFGISGRMIDATAGTFEVLAVGGIGNQVLYSKGNGQWSQMPTMGSADRAVFMTADGQAVAVGSGGVILHYF